MLTRLEATRYSEEEACSHCGGESDVGLLLLDVRARPGAGGALLCGRR
jgi:hypothetical protein